MNGIISAEVLFNIGEQQVRTWAASLGDMVQYLPPHFTLLYGAQPFAPNMEAFMAQFTDPDHPIYMETPKPVAFHIFPNEEKNYNALAIEYEWPAGKAVNLAASSDPAIFPKGPTSGFNGDKFTAHVTVAYVDAEEDGLYDEHAEEPCKIMQHLLEHRPAEGMSFFDVTVKNVALEISVKPQNKKPKLNDL